MKTIPRINLGLRMVLLLGLILPACAARRLHAQTPSEFQPVITWHGRAVAVTVNPANDNEAIVASESGGLFKTTDHGQNWTHLDNLSMFRMKDVKYGPVTPGIPSLVIASGYSDSHVLNLGGIWRSTDGGQTWAKPDSTYTSCVNRESTYGIAFEPGTSNVFVGSDCGLTVSRDAGATFGLVYPNGIQGRIMAVAAQHGGIVDVCGDSGHMRSTNSGVSFSAPTDTRTPESVHGLAVSPDEAGVVFLASANGVNALFSDDCPGGRDVAVFEGDYQADGNVIWSQVIPAVCNISRPCWVNTNPSRDDDPNHFDIYFGSGETCWRQTVTAKGGTQPRCYPFFAVLPRFPQGWTPVISDHSDFNAVAFSTAAGNHCAEYMATDGGIEAPNDLACGGSWQTLGVDTVPGQPYFGNGTALTMNRNNGYNALQIYQVASQMDLVETPPPHTDLYIANMDNSLWASADGGRSWPFVTGAEGNFLQVQHYAISDECCQTVTWLGWGNGGEQGSTPLYSSVALWNNPPGKVIANPLLASATLNGVQVFAQWSQYNTLSITTDAGAHWQAYTLGAGFISLLSLQGFPQAAVSGNQITIYQPYKQSGFLPGGDARIGLLRITGFYTDGTASNPQAYLADTGGLGSLGSYGNGEGDYGAYVFAVDPNDPSHLIAPDIGNHAMMVSTDGGGSWTADTQLTSLVTAGAIAFDTPANEYPGYQEVPGAHIQVHSIAFDPNHQGSILVGTEAAGIFRSTDGGASWFALPGSGKVTAITSFAFIDENRDQNNVYPEAIVSTFGRGLWKIALTPPPQTNAVPFHFPDSVITNLADLCWLQTPTGDCMGNITSNCPTCIYHAVVGGQITGFRVDTNGLVTTLMTDTGRLVTSSGDGQPLHSYIDLVSSMSFEAFDGCPQCTNLVAQGGVIKGVVVDALGHLQGIFGGFGALPGEDDVDAFSAPAGALADLPGAAAPTQPYLTLTGTMTIAGLTACAASGDPVGASGSGFCGDPDCPPVELAIDGVVLTNVQVNADGTFQTTFTAGQAKGSFLVTATQQIIGGPLYVDSAQLVVVRADDDDAEVADMPPQLSININGQVVTLYWDLDQQGFVVQRTESLTPPVNWQTYPVKPVVQGESMAVTLPLSGMSGYFRLVSSATLPPPPTAPIAVTTTATLVSSNSAQLNGTVTPDGADTTYWFEYGLDTNYTGGMTASSVVTADNTNAVGVASALNGLSLSTSYHFQLVASNSVGVSYGGDQGFSTSSGAPPPAPDLVTLAASSITSNSAVLNGTIHANGSQAVAHFHYGLDTGYTSGQVGTYFTFQTGDVEPFSYTLTGLTPNTTYHFQAFGFNCCVEGFGGDMSFTTASNAPTPPPTVTTLAASSVTTSGAVLNGSVNPNGFSTTAFFEYGTTTGYGTITTQQGIGTTVQNDFQATLSGLSSFTTYHYRMDANNAGGISYGADNTFTTAWVPVPPTLVSPGTATPGSPQVVGTLTPTFNWTGASQASSLDIVVNVYPSGASAAVIAATGTSLVCPNGVLAAGTEYEWHMVAFNSLGDESANSSSLYFQTASAPTVQTLAASNVLSTTAQLKGFVNPNGAGTTAYFEYGTTTSYGTITTQTGIGTTAQNFSANIGGLSLNTTYHYRINGVNGIGTSHGVDMTFKTED